MVSLPSSSWRWTASTGILALSTAGLLHDGQHAGLHGSRQGRPRSEYRLEVWLDYSVRSSPLDTGWTLGGCMPFPALSTRFRALSMRFLFFDFARFVSQ